MICNNCKRFFMNGNRPSGIPNGVKLIMKDRRSVTLCADCMILVGTMDDKRKGEFFDGLLANAPTEPPVN